jgi:hypothetical protein
MWGSSDRVPKRSQNHQSGSEVDFNGSFTSGQLRRHVGDVKLINFAFTGSVRIVLPRNEVKHMHMNCQLDRCRLAKTEIGVLWADGVLKVSLTTLIEDNVTKQKDYCWSVFKMFDLFIWGGHFFHDLEAVPGTRAEDTCSISDEILIIGVGGAFLIMTQTHCSGTLSRRVDRKWPANVL